MSKSDDGIECNMSQFFPMKRVLEDVLGSDTYTLLKENADLSDWMKSVDKLFRAIELSIEETVKVADPKWYSEVSDIIKLGKKECSHAKNEGELFSDLSAALTRLVFLQIGLMPTHGPRAACVRLIPQNWRLDTFRTVQYVQNVEQKEALQSLLSQRNAPRTEFEITPPSSSVIS